MSEPNKELKHPFDTITVGPAAEKMYMDRTVRVSGKPRTTDHNISDDYIREGPPQV